MIVDEPNIAQILKKYLHETHDLVGIAPMDTIEDLGLDVIDSIEFEEFICGKFRINESYINLSKHKTFGDLIKHIYTMKFYCGIVHREIGNSTKDKGFYCLIIKDPFQYEVFHKRPSLLRYFKAYLTGEKFIYGDITAYWDMR